MKFKIYLKYNLQGAPAHRGNVVALYSKNAIAYALLLITVLVWTGCKKQLALVSQDSITDATFYKTPHDFKLAANQLYNGLDRFGFEDTESDIAFSFPNSVSNGSLQLTDVASEWNGSGRNGDGNSYVYIRDCNNILEKGAASSDAEIKIYLAEAKFFRAWYYWKLFRLYGGVPLITKVLTTDDAALFTPRATRQETADQILKDLADAQKDLPVTSDLSTPDIGRVTKGAALALSSRVALFEGTWEKFRGDASSSKYLDIAIASSNAVINSGKYALYTGSGAQSYRYLFIEAGDDSRESILDRRYARNILGHDMPYQYDGNGYNPTRKLADFYLDKNGVPITSPGTVFQGYNTMVSEFQNRDPRMTMTMIIPGTLTNRVFFPVTKVANYPDKPQRNFNTGYILYKYMSEDPIANNSGQNGDQSMFDYDRHLIRYAEVLLNYAEATFEKNGSISDVDLNSSINVVRDRAGMPHLSNAFAAAHSLDMRTELRRERTVELALEGFRYDDIRRWKTAETELPQDVKGIKIKGTQWQSYPLYSDPAYQNKTDASGFLIAETNRTFDPAKNYLQPIPTKEVAFYQASGHKLEQNPGW